MIKSGNQIRLHNIIYVPNLNVSLFSIRKNKKCVECYEHSENNICSIAFPSIITQVNNEELVFSARKPSSDHSIAPSFDKATAKVYTPEVTTIIFDCTSSANAYEVTILSTLKFEPVQYVPARPIPVSIGYDLNFPMKISVPPQSRNAIPLGLLINTPQIYMDTSSHTMRLNLIKTLISLLEL